MFVPLIVWNTFFGISSALSGPLLKRYVMIDVSGANSQSDHLPRGGTGLESVGTLTTFFSVWRHINLTTLSPRTEPCTTNNNNVNTDSL